MYQPGDKVVVTGNGPDHTGGGVFHHFQIGEVCTVDNVLDRTDSKSLSRLGVTETVGMTSEKTGTYQTVDSRDCRPYRITKNSQARGLLKSKN